MIELDNELEPYREKCNTFGDLKEYMDRIYKSNHKGLCILHQNINSLRKNWVLFSTYLERNTGNKVDVIVLTEISIYNYENDLYKIKGYNTVCYNRIKQKGGGVLILIKDYLQIINSDFGKCSKSGYEYVQVELVMNQVNTRLIAVYRPPNCNVNMFIKEIECRIQIINKHHNIILIGDINIDLLKDDYMHVTMYQDVLDENGMSRCNS